MDPLSFVTLFIGYILGALFFKGAKHVLTSPRDSGSIAISSYESRWNDKKYVAMIHKTRAAEQEAGIELSPCMCSNHKPIIVDRTPLMIPSGKPAYAGMHRVQAMAKSGVMENNNGVITFHRPLPKNYEKHIEGHTFIVGAEVPKDCYGMLEYNTPSGTVYGIFKWMDDKGQIKYYRVPAMPDFETHYVMAGDSNKPVRTFSTRQIDQFPSRRPMTSERRKAAVDSLLKKVGDVERKVGTLSTGPQ